MKRNNKKGFTITELVIVIAVIAILAAVLIPTFSGAIDKAKKSSADQTVRNALSVMLYEDTDATLDEGTYYFAYKEGNTTYYYKYDGGKLVDLTKDQMDTAIAALGTGTNYKVYNAAAVTAARIFAPQVQAPAANFVQYGDLNTSVEVLCVLPNA